ncbi:GNAT family N-acetyltransferase [Fluviibacterium sp. DFM31]|uniref:GNAT family N-acetyltransferase n=1 Tax=Meridianimarinicoccus marinus TaxID=3231483 RepID=A0ABV3L5N7_9RHOB
MIRAARPSDLPQLAELYRRGAMANAGDVEKLQAHPELLELDVDLLDVIHVCEDPAGAIIGFAALTPSRPEAELLALFVDPFHTRKGIGRALLHAALGEAVSAGCTSCRLVVNSAAYGFYTRLGFEEIAQVETPLGPAPMMRRVLTEAAPGQTPAIPFPDAFQTPESEDS